MTRLSEKQLEQYDSGLFFPGRNSIQLVELVRGYRRAAALEDMLREWLDSATFKIDPCDRCGGTVGSIAHTRCIRTRTAALLAEGDE